MKIGRWTVEHANGQPLTTADTPAFDRVTSAYRGELVLDPDQRRIRLRSVLEDDASRSDRVSRGLDIRYLFPIEATQAEVARILAHEDVQALLDRILDSFTVDEDHPGGLGILKDRDADLSLDDWIHRNARDFLSRSLLDASIYYEGDGAQLDIAADATDDDLAVLAPRLERDALGDNVILEGAYEMLVRLRDRARAEA